MLLASQEKVVEQQQNEEKEELQSVFGDFLEFEETEQAPEPEEEAEIFYLWDIKEPIFSIFKILRNFFLDDYRFDSALMLRLIDNRNLDLEDALLDLSYIRQGFMSKLPKGT